MYKLFAHFDFCSSMSQRAYILVMNQNLTLIFFFPKNVVSKALRRLKTETHDVRIWFNRLHLWHHCSDGCVSELGTYQQSEKKNVEKYMKIRNDKRTSKPVSSVYNNIDCGG